MDVLLKAVIIFQNELLAYRNKYENIYWKEFIMNILFLKILVTN